MSARKLWLVSFMVCAMGWSADRGLVGDKNAKNVLLSIGVSHGLPGIDIDVNNVVKMGEDANYQFAATKLMNSDGTVEGIQKKTTELASKVDTNGTFFWYFSGHGSVGSLLAQDKEITIQQIRQAIEDARDKKGPLNRLVMMFDSCHAGSLLDPLRTFAKPRFVDERAESNRFVDEVVAEFTSNVRAGAYWKNLFVFASSLADETSLAGENGSVFTVALKKAFDESVQANSKMSDFVALTKKYTVGHHPIERFSPKSLADEKMY